MGSALLISIALFAALAVWLNLVRAWLRRPEPGATRLSVPTPDGWTLAVFHHRAKTRKYLEPVILCHGLANTHRIMSFEEPISLAGYLSARGFECYAVDLRGAGESGPPAGALDDATVDDHIRFDVPAVVEAVRRHAGAPQVLWLGHSLGGLVGLSAAATGLAPQFKGLVTIGSPVFFSFRYRVDWLARVGSWLAPAGRFPAHWLAELVAPVSGLADIKLAHTSANLSNVAKEVRPRLMANVFAPIWRGVLGQLEHWIRRDCLASLDGSVDYRAAIVGLTLPLLVCSGTVDQLAIALGQRRYFEALRAPDKTHVIFGKGLGQHEDYGHGDLLIGQHAHEEVYPVVAAWLEARARWVLTAPQVSGPQAQAPGFAVAPAAQAPHPVGDARPELERGVSEQPPLD